MDRQIGDRVKLDRAGSPAASRLGGWFNHVRGNLPKRIAISTSLALISIGIEPPAAVRTPGIRPVRVWHAAAADFFALSTLNNASQQAVSRNSGKPGKMEAGLLAEGASTTQAGPCAGSGSEVASPGAERCGPRRSRSPVQSPTAPGRSGH